MTEQLHTDGGSDRSTELRESTADVGDERPSEVVVRTVATLTNTAPLDLEPLYDTVDPESLDATFAETDGDAVTAEVSFVYDGCTVTITDGTVHARVVDGR